MKPFTKPKRSRMHLHHRHQAVGGAARVGDDVVLGGVVRLVVDAVDDGDVLLLGGRGDDDLLGAALQVQRGLVPVGEAAGATRARRRRRAPSRAAWPGPSPRARASRRRRRRARPSRPSTSPGKRPCTESYLSRWASVLVSVMSFTATKSISLAPIAWAARTTLRPMRPKPLMPTRIAIVSPSLGSLRQRSPAAPARAKVTASTRAAPAAPERHRRLRERGAGGEDVVHQDARELPPRRAPRRPRPRWPAAPSGVSAVWVRVSRRRTRRAAPHRRGRQPAPAPRRSARSDCSRAAAAAARPAAPVSRIPARSMARGRASRPPAPRRPATSPRT